MLRSTFQKIDFFRGERKFDFKDWTNFVTKNPFYIVLSKQTRLFALKKLFLLRLANAK